MARYIPIHISDVYPDRPIPFSIYARIKGLDEVLLFARAGASISAERLKELAWNKNMTFLIDLPDLSAFKSYFARRAKIHAPGTPEEVIQAGIEHILLKERDLGYRRLPGFSLTGALAASGVVTLIEIYAGVRETSAVIIGAIAAFALFLVFLAVIKTEKEPEQPHVAQAFQPVEKQPREDAEEPPRPARDVTPPEKEPEEKAPAAAPS